MLTLNALMLMSVTLSLIKHSEVGTYLLQTIQKCQIGAQTSLIFDLIGRTPKINAQTSEQ